MLHKAFLYLTTLITVFLTFFLSIAPLFAIENIFSLESQFLPERVEFEKKRRICYFPFRQKGEDAGAEYLVTGLPSVLYSKLFNTHYVFDKQVMAEVIYHKWGNTKKQTSQKKIINHALIQKLNRGQLEMPPVEDPRYIKLEHLVMEKENAPIIGSELYLAEKHDCFYLISGEFERLAADSLQIQVQILDRRSGQQKSFRHNSGFRRSYQEMDPLLQELQAYFNPSLGALITVRSKKAEGFLVYLDENYLGKTPILEKKVAAGKHQLSLVREGYITERFTIQLKKNIHSKYDILMKKQPLEGFLTITSQPKGADVYLGMTHLGKTPLKNIPVATGANRVRVSLPEHIDFFRGVEIQKGQSVSLEARLLPGKTIPYYQNQFNLFMDYTYFDFAIYSLYSMLMFYGGAAYHDVMANRTRDQLRTEVFIDQFTLFSYVSSAGSLSQEAVTGFTTQFFYEVLRTRRNEARVRRYQQIRDINAVAGTSMIFMAMGFYYLGYSDDSLEFGLNIQPTASQSFYSEARSDLQFTYRF